MAKKSRKKKTTAKRKRGTRSKKKKSPAKKRTLKKRKPAQKAKKKKSAGVPKGIELPAEPIGRVTHYFPKVRATAVMIEREEIRVGDTLYFKGHTTRFKQRVDSLQVNHQTVTQASAGEEVGIQTRSRTREHDRVFKLA